MGDRSSAGKGDRQQSAYVVVIERGGFAVPGGGLNPAGCIEYKVRSNTIDVLYALRFAPGKVIGEKGLSTDGISNLLELTAV